MRRLFSPIAHSFFPSHDLALRFFSGPLPLDYRILFTHVQPAFSYPLHQARLIALWRLIPPTHCSLLNPCFQACSVLPFSPHFLGFCCQTAMKKGTAARKHSLTDCTSSASFIISQFHSSPPPPCFFISYGFNGNLVGMGLGTFSLAISCNLSNLPPDLFMSSRHVPRSRRLHSAPRCTAQHGVHHFRCAPHYPARLSSPYLLHSRQVVVGSVLIRRVRASCAQDCHSPNRQVPHLLPRLQPHHVHRNPRVCVSVGNAVTAAPSRHIRDPHFATSACICHCTSPCILQSTMPCAARPHSCYR